MESSRNPIGHSRVCSTTFLETTEGHESYFSEVYTPNIFEYFKFNWDSINPGTQIIDGRFNPEDVEYYEQAFEYDKWVHEKRTLVAVSDSPIPPTILIYYNLLHTY